MNWGACRKQKSTQIWAKLHVRRRCNCVTRWTYRLCIWQTSQNHSWCQNQDDARIKKYYFSTTDVMAFSKTKIRQRSGKRLNYNSVNCRNNLYDEISCKQKTTLYSNPMAFETRTVKLDELHLSLWWQVMTVNSGTRVGPAACHGA